MIIQESLTDPPWCVGVDKQQLSSVCVQMLQMLSCKEEAPF